MSDASSGIVTEDHHGNWVRLRTLIVVRWIGIGGQFTAILVARNRLNIEVEIGYCFALIAISAVLNTALTTVLPANTRLTARQAMYMLLFDIFQLLALVALTGGLDNPFAVLVIAPVVIAATALPLRPMLIVAGLAIVMTTLVAVIHVPLRLADGTELSQPPLLTVGFFIAITTGIGFVAIYARQVSLEIHTMSEALLATQMALARAQKLTDLGGVVAAAAHELGTPLATIKLTASEMAADLEDQPELAEDARLIRQQADRCRDILQSMGRAGKRDSYVTQAPITAVVREAAEPHTGRGKTVHIELAEGLDDARQPLIERRPELIHGLRNLVQNAVDFASTGVWVQIAWTGSAVALRIRDDGPGYPPHLISRLGDPFLPRRERPDPGRPEYEGMGLGLFIAKTLLERTGAEVDFMNARDDTGGGALVTVTWPAQSGIVVDRSLRPTLEENLPITG